MPFLRLNKKSLDLDIKVGALEEYKPDSEIEEIAQELELIKKLIKDKSVELFGDKSTHETLQLIKSNEELRQKWTEYLDKEYKPLIEQVMERIHKKNLKVCSGYTEYIKSKER